MRTLHNVFSLLLALAPALTAQVAAEIEPNDLPAQATAVVCGQHIEAAANYTGDVDWFTFTLAAPARVTILSGSSATGTVLDDELELYDAALNLLARNDDDDREWLAAISTYLPAGTYRLWHRGYGAGTGPYSLDIQCDTTGAATPRVAETAEPNGDPLAGGAPMALLVGGIGDGVLAAGDSDWWQFTLATPTVCRIEVGRGLVGTFSPDTYLYLRDASGALLEADDDDGPGAWSLVVATLPAGTYYADVQGYGGANPGSYTLLLQTFDASLALGESPEPNGDPLLAGQPSVLACGVLGEGEIAAGDSDWWAFTLAEETFVDLTSWGGRFQNGLTTIQNPNLAIYDAASLQLVASTGNTFYDRHERIRVWLPVGSYFAEITASTAAATGTYTLRLACNQSAQYHVFAGGCVGSNGLAPRWTVRHLEQPLIGTTFVGEFRDCPANGVVFPFLGFSRTVALGSIPLPLDLGVVGAPGCVLDVDPVVSTGLLTDAIGGATWAFPIPQVPALSGVVIAQQAFVFDPTVNALGLTLSNAGHGVLTNLR